jgi:hypothetical protein
MSLDSPFEIGKEKGEEMRKGCVTYPPALPKSPYGDDVGRGLVA